MMLSRILCSVGGCCAPDMFSSLLPMGACVPLVDVGGNGGGPGGFGCGGRCQLPIVVAVLWWQGDQERHQGSCERIVATDAGLCVTLRMVTAVRIVSVMFCCLHEVCQPYWTGVFFPMVHPSSQI